MTPLTAHNPDQLLLPPDEALFERLAEGIENQGYIVLPTALPTAVAEGLLDCLSRIEQREFRAARIGRGSHRKSNRFVRRDRIHWIEPALPGGRGWHDWLHRLREYLNRRLFLGLFSVETHFSLYREGDFYRRHMDAFRGESNRVLSLVTYLNRGWLPDQGGELVIHDPAGGEPLISVAPGFGTLVLFLSEEFPHEVLPTVRERYGVSAWFRLNGSHNESIDPPR
jgi:SM-20-related protein